MQTFTSSISGKKFPLQERVSGHSLRLCILREVQKDHPAFNEADELAEEELNFFRNRYITSVLESEIGNLSELEKKVLEVVNAEQTLATRLRTEENQEKLSTGEKLADRIASFGGSWTFIIIFLCIIVIWMLINSWPRQGKPFDPFPFILLNLVLSCLAALQAPVIMMSQNRQEQKDRNRSMSDYMINLKAELELRILHEKMDHLIKKQQEDLFQIQQVQMDMMQDILRKISNK